MVRYFQLPAFATSRSRLLYDIQRYAALLPCPVRRDEAFTRRQVPMQLLPVSGLRFRRAEITEGALLKVVHAQR